MARDPKKSASTLKKAASFVLVFIVLFVPCLADSDSVSVRLEDLRAVYSNDSKVLVVELALDEAVSADSYEFSISYDGSILSLRSDGLTGPDASVRLEAVEGNERIIGVSSATEDVSINSLGTLVFDIVKKGDATVSIAKRTSWINRMATADTTVINPAECSVKVTCQSPGDINGDDFVDLLDLVRLVKYHALSGGVDIPDSCSLDTNADGAENAADIVRLAQYIANPTEVDIY